MHKKSKRRDAKEFMNTRKKESKLVRNCCGVQTGVRQNGKYIHLHVSHRVNYHSHFQPGEEVSAGKEVS